MKGIGFVIYILIINNKEYRVGLTSDLEVELSYLKRRRGFTDEELQAYSLTKPLPIGLAKYIYEEITARYERQGALIDDLAGGIKALLLEYSKRVERLLDYYSLLDYSQVEEVEASGYNNLPDLQELEEVHKILAGRLLYYSEIKQALAENQVLLKSPLKLLLQGLKLESKLEIGASLAYQDRNYLVCQRCGEDEKLVEIDCNYCGLTDYYCDCCLYMGKARTCRPLYAFNSDFQLSATRLTEEEQKVEPKLEFSLTAAQRDASQQLVDFIASDGKEALVWAVCGAGKTEVSFQAIGEVLSQGGEVLFAIPRKDAVVELAPRLKASFPDFEFSLLYGGSERKYDVAPITVATTHQVLRFINKFDLIILDEVDAFPYQGSKMLAGAVERACHPQGKIINMTATPGEELSRFNGDKQRRLIKIPARYHGHPVPTPKLLTAEISYNKESKRVDITQKVLELIKDSIYRDLAQLFIFLPTRELVEIVGKKLQRSLPEIEGESWVQYSHAQDEHRDRKREEFCQGKYPILVSTTIMERAITVPKANVLVLFADWDFVFDVPTLIQMAGRAGRSLEYPQGEIWFVGQMISKAMKESKERIEDLNQEADKKGYLKSGS